MKGKKSGTRLGEFGRRGQSGIFSERVKHSPGFLGVIDAPGPDPCLRQDAFSRKGRCLRSGCRRLDRLGCGSGKAVRDRQDDALFHPGIDLFHDRFIWLQGLFLGRESLFAAWNSNGEVVAVPKCSKSPGVGKEQLELMAGSWDELKHRRRRIVNPPNEIDNPPLHPCC